MAHLVGDVSSAARILPDLDGEKLFIQRGRGAYLWDAQGRRYIDTALGFGAVLLGHSEPAVIERWALPCRMPPRRPGPTCASMPPRDCPTRWALRPSRETARSRRSSSWSIARSEHRMFDRMPVLSGA